jgi:antirestriction protein
MLLLLLLFVADRQNQEREIDTAADIVLDIEDEAYFDFEAVSVWWRASSLGHSSKLFLTTERREIC